MTGPATKTVPPLAIAPIADADVATVIALWLGHEQTDTTMIYLHADLTLKERALARTAPRGTPTGRYKPPDDLLAFLEAL